MSTLRRRLLALTASVISAGVLVGVAPAPGSAARAPRAGLASHLVMGAGGQVRPGTATPTTNPPTTNPPTTIPPTAVPPSHGLTLGQKVSGGVARTSQQYDYTFTATAGEVVYLESNQARCAPKPPWWQLLGPGGTFSGYTGDVCADLGRVVLATAGTWTVNVYSRGGKGPYAFTALAVPATITTPVNLGPVVAGAISHIGEEHDYTFAGTAGEVVYLQAKTSGCGPVSLWWELLTPAGTFNGFAGGVCDDLGRVVLATSGTWTVQAYPQGRFIGRYAFEVLPVPATTTTPISLGQHVSGGINHKGQQRNYTFTAPAGHVVYVESKLHQCEPGPQVWWQLTNPGGSVVWAEPACSGIAHSLSGSPGTWTIGVYSRGGSIGPYAFEVSKHIA